MTIVSGSYGVNVVGTGLRDKRPESEADLRILTMLSRTLGQLVRVWLQILHPCMMVTTLVLNTACSTSTSLLTMPSSAIPARELVY